MPLTHYVMHRLRRHTCRSPWNCLVKARSSGMKFAFFSVKPPPSKARNVFFAKKTVDDK